MAAGNNGNVKAPTTYITWAETTIAVPVGETVTVGYSGTAQALTKANVEGFLGDIATANTNTVGSVTFTGVSAGTATIPFDALVGLSIYTSNVLNIAVTASTEDESYLNKRGLTHFWENIDDIKQDKLTAGAGISITGNTISATGGGTADAVEWANVLNKPTFSTVATSGSYNDLSNKPTIGNATLTIQKNGTSAGTFTANATSNKTINITVPTTAADVSALPASTKYGASIAVSINTTDYKVTTALKDQDGNTLGTAQVIDLPLESVVVNGSYDNTNKKIILTLQNGNTVDIPVADLVAGLQSEITSTNKLASDLVDDTNQTHKFVTAAQITKLNGIATGAEVNQNAFSNVKVGSTTVAADSKTDTLELVAGSNVTLTPDATNDKVTIAATDTTYSNATTSTAGLMSASDKTKLNGIASGAEVNVQANWTQTTTTADDYIKNKPTLATVATSGSYNDLSNKPTIPTVNNATLTIQKNGTNVQTFTANQGTNATANITVPTTVLELSDSANYATTAALASKQDTLIAGDHIDITNNTISAVDYVHSEQPVSTSAVTPVVTGSMISNGTITADKLASGATVKLTLSTSDIGEGAALAANTLYGVYQ